MVRHDGAPVTRETLAPIAAAMSFYGPDGHGQWCGDTVGLGHLMLHVTPESLMERLPASIRVAPHLVITADARIDNRDELFDALGAPRQGREQTPDSSLILLAYEKWGPDSVKRLLGDFAFAIWDSRERKLFCARDPFGCKPFVYHYEGKRFVFASDVKGVLARVESPRLNEPLLAAYLQMRTYHAEKKLTFFEEIVKLPPAHSLTLSAGQPETSRYWSPEDAPEIRLATEADYAEQLGFLFRQSVECRLRSAFPIGCHLSGGLDTSAIGILASRSLRDRGRELPVFSWSPPPGSSTIFRPDSEYARIDAVCRQEQLSCEYLPATAASLITSFQRDFTIEPMAMIAREGNVEARAEARHLRVILSGWGGDEAVTSHASTGCDTSSLRRLGGSLRRFVIRRLPDSLYGLAANPFLEHRSPCLQPEFARRHRREVKELRGRAWRLLPDVRATVCLHLETGNIPMRVEHWTASGARHGLVYRYPMLDKRLVEFALGVPASQLCQPGKRRALFRRAVDELLPSSADWLSVKHEGVTLAALTDAYKLAYPDWAQHLTLQMPESRATRFVDPARIRNAVQSAVRSGRLGEFSGVREAFGCYAIRL